MKRFRLTDRTCLVIPPEMEADFRSRMPWHWRLWHWLRGWFV